MSKLIMLASYFRVNHSFNAHFEDTKNQVSRSFGWLHCWFMMLVALGAQWQTWPPYTASICIKRWRSSEGEQLLRILYNGHKVTPPVSDREHKSTQKRTLLTLGKLEGLAEWFLLSRNTIHELCQNVCDLRTQPQWLLYCLHSSSFWSRLCWIRWIEQFAK